jgi:hypothetical protein
MLFTALVPVLTLATPTLARKISFPPVAAYHVQLQRPVSENGGIDVSMGSAFAGLTTFANLPYVHCLAGSDQDVEKYDIAILGAPFDTVSCGFPVFFLDMLGGTNRKSRSWIGGRSEKCGGERRYCQPA